jgi:transaldolase
MTTPSPLLQTVSTTPTDYWNDSCSVAELTYAIGHGAVGATTNPNIVLNVLKQEMHLWDDRIRQIIAENPTWSESEVAWKLIEEMAVHGAGLLRPAWERNAGHKGRISIQTNPMFYRNCEAIVAQARHFDTLAPNMQVKMPVTQAGVMAVEESTYHGVNINATVSFTVPQAVAVAEAVERGLNRRAAEGKDVQQHAPRLYDYDWPHRRLGEDGGQARRHRH